MATQELIRRSGQNGPNNRDQFWRFCAYTSARTRMVKSDARGELSAYDIDKLFVDQNWRCAISGVRFDPPGELAPFGPSLDRIVAGGRYEIGNVRLVCTIVNFAMNQWGEAALRRLVTEMSRSKL
jgi:hypothetical protein